MAKQSREWSEIMIRRGLIGPDQFKEAQAMKGVVVEDALVKLGYASHEQIIQAKAEQHGMDYVDLNEVEIPAGVVELIPESLARENFVMPMSSDGAAIKVIMHDPICTNKVKQ